MNMFFVTFPTLMWTFFPPVPHGKMSPKFFWRSTLGAVWPIALLSGFAVTAVYSTLTKLSPSTVDDNVTISVLTATFFGIYLVFLAPKMLNVVYDSAAKQGRRLYLLASFLVIVVSFAFEFTRDFFSFTVPTFHLLLLAAVIVTAVATLQYHLAVWSGKKSLQRTR
jgi:hypothetical protein